MLNESWKTIFRNSFHENGWQINKIVIEWKKVFFTISMKWYKLLGNF